MQSLKQNIEQYIKDNWAETPIFWFGTDFNAKNIDKYIQVKVLPNEREKIGLNVCSKKVGIFLEIYAYAHEDIESIGMLDRVSDMFDLSTFDTDSTSTYGSGYQDNNMWFNTWRVNVSKYNEG